MVFYPEIQKEVMAHGLSLRRPFISLLKGSSHHFQALLHRKIGKSQVALQDLLGHTSSKMTQRYVHMAQRCVRAEFVNYSPLDRLEDEKNDPP